METRRLRGKKGGGEGPARRRLLELYPPAQITQRVRKSFAPLRAVSSRAVAMSSWLLKGMKHPLTTLKPYRTVPSAFIANVCEDSPSV